jgi:hypothetical protein
MIYAFACRNKIHVPRKNNQSHYKESAALLFKFGDVRVAWKGTIFWKKHRVNKMKKPI